MNEPSESSELTDDERRDLKRRLEVVGAIVSEVDRLLCRREPFAELLQDASAMLLNKWSGAWAALAILLIWIGRNLSDFTWLELVGITILCFGGVIWVLIPSINSFDARQNLGRIDAQLWEMHYRWLANGGHAKQFDDLKALHQPRVGIPVGSCEYERWWNAVRSQMQGKAMLLF